VCRVQESVETSGVREMVRRGGPLAATCIAMINSN
jgi:hypothetical protein